MKYGKLAVGILSSLMLLSAAQGAIVGYVNTTFQTGDNLFGNPLLSGSDHLSTLFSPQTPVGTTVSLWDSSLGHFGSSSVWNGSSWSSDLTLTPGMGVLLHTPEGFVNTFSGTVLNFDGSILTGDLTQPPAFTGANGIYLFASRAPVALSGHVFDPTLSEFSAFEAIIGRAPHPGEQVTTFDALTQTYITTSFVSGVWNNGDPTLGVGEAAFINIGAVPEPASLSLFGLALGTAVLVRRRALASR